MAFRIQDMFRKSASRSFNEVDPDPAAAEKQPLRIIRIIIIVIRIILWYNTDIRLPVQLSGESSDLLLLLWYNEARWDSLSAQLFHQSTNHLSGVCRVGGVSLTVDLQ